MTARVLLFNLLICLAFSHSSLVLADRDNSQQENGMRDGQNYNQYVPENYQAYIPTQKAWDRSHHDRDEFNHEKDSDHQQSQYIPKWINQYIPSNFNEKPSNDDRTHHKHKISHKEEMNRYQREADYNKFIPNYAKTREDKHFPDQEQGTAGQSSMGGWGRAISSNEDSSSVAEDRSALQADIRALNLISEPQQPDPASQPGADYKAGDYQSYIPPIARQYVPQAAAPPPSQEVAPHKDQGKHSIKQHHHEAERMEKYEKEKAEVMKEPLEFIPDVARAYMPVSVQKKIIEDQKAKAEHEAYLKSKSERENEEHKLTSLQDERADAKSSIRDLEKRKNSIHHRIHHLEDTTSELKHSVSHQADKRDNLKESIHDHEKTLHELKKDIHHHEKEKKSLADSIKDHKHKLDKLKDEIDKHSHHHHSKKHSKHNLNEADIAPPLNGPGKGLNTVSYFLILCFMGISLASIGYFVNHVWNKRSEYQAL